MFSLCVNDKEIRLGDEVLVGSFSVVINLLGKKEGKRDEKGWEERERDERGVW